MWTCIKCGRIFEKAKQPHSCKKIPLENHFENKETARELFAVLLMRVEKKVGKCQVISIPCCIHLFGKSDFLAVLPKKEKLEIRFSLNRKLDSPRLIQAVPLSATAYKNCIEVSDKEEIDSQLLDWIVEAYK